MSWGVDIYVTHSDGYVTKVDVVDGHTYNLTPMWRLAGVVDRSTGELDARRCEEMLPILDAALADATARPEAYRELDPPNGWGDYEGFLAILGRLTALCHLHSTGVLRWNG